LKLATHIFSFVLNIELIEAALKQPGNAAFFAFRPGAWISNKQGAES
jgi:hypothetical protein